MHQIKGYFTMIVVIARQLVIQIQIRQDLPQIDDLPLGIVPFLVVILSQGRARSGELLLVPVLRQNIVLWL